MIFSLKGTNS